MMQVDVPPIQIVPGIAAIRRIRENVDMAERPVHASILKEPDPNGATGLDARH
jgi:hypothetical protein